jgi:hypothetical protein
MQNKFEKIEIRFGDAVEKVPGDGVESAVQTIAHGFQTSPKAV